MTTTEQQDSHRRGERAPSAAYDGCNTPEAVNARFKELFAAAQAKGVFTKEDNQALGEDMRLAHVRVAARVNGRTAPGEPRPRRERVQTVARPTEHPDGTLTIVCGGPCAEEKPAKKYPTLHKGGRGSVCRDCERALRAERKGA